MTVICLWHATRNSGKSGQEFCPVSPMLRAIPLVRNGKVLTWSYKTTLPPPNTHYPSSLSQLPALSVSLSSHTCLPRMPQVHIQPIVFAIAIPTEPLYPLYLGLVVPIALNLLWIHCSVRLCLCLCLLASTRI